MSTQFQLSAPIQAHGETLNFLTVRTPTGRDIAAAGMPVTMAEEGRMDAAAMHRLIVRLCDIPSSSADALSAGDWMRLAALIMGFFQMAEPPSTTTSPSVGGGETSPTS